MCKLTRGRDETKLTRREVDERADTVNEVKKLGRNEARRSRERRGGRFTKEGKKESRWSEVRGTLFGRR